MSFIGGNQNFKIIVNSVKDHAVSVKQFAEVHSKEFINFLGRNVTLLKNEHPKAAKAALIAGTVFVVGTVVVVIYKKWCAKKAANKALNDAAKKTAQSADVNLSNKKAEELAAASKLALEQSEQAEKALKAAEEAKYAKQQAEEAEQAKKEVSEAKAKQAEAEEEAEEAKKAKEILNEQFKVEHDKINHIIDQVKQVDADIYNQQLDRIQKKSAFIDYKNMQSAAKHLPLIKFKIEDYTREEAIIHFTSKKFLESGGKGIVYDATIVSKSLNLFFDYYEKNIQVLNLEKKKKELVKNRDQLFDTLEKLSLELKK